jgi:hypothetical protein
MPWERKKLLTSESQTNEEGDRERERSCILFVKAKYYVLGQTVFFYFKLVTLTRSNQFRLLNSNTAVEEKDV